MVCGSTDCGFGPNCGRVALNVFFIFYRFFITLDHRDYHSTASTSYSDNNRRIVILVLCVVIIYYYHYHYIVSSDGQ